MSDMLDVFMAHSTLNELCIQYAEEYLAVKQKPLRKGA